MALQNMELLVAGGFTKSSIKTADFVSRVYRKEIGELCHPGSARLRERHSKMRAASWLCQTGLVFSHHLRVVLSLHPARIFFHISRTLCALTPRSRPEHPGSSLSGTGPQAHRSHPKSSFLHLVLISSLRLLSFRSLLYLCCTLYQ